MAIIAPVERPHGLCSLITPVLRFLGVTRIAAEAASAAFVKSLWYTGCAFVTAIFVQMAVDGGLTSPQAAGTWMRSKLWTYAIGFFVAPLLRAHGMASYVGGKVAEARAISEPAVILEK